MCSSEQQAWIGADPIDLTACHTAPERIHVCLGPYGRVDLAVLIFVVLVGERDVVERRLQANIEVRVKSLQLQHGEVREARVSCNRGGPENPLSNEELEVKFRTNAGRVLPAKQVEELRCALEALGGADTMGDVTRLAGTRGSVRSDRRHAGG